MATLVPPPSKKQKTAAAERARLQQELDVVPDGLGSIRINFINRQGAGKLTPTAINIPIKDANVRNLTELVNSLEGNLGPDRVPYTFTCQPRSGKDESADAQIVRINSGVWHDLLRPALVGTEGEIEIEVAPEAVFRVRAVTRPAASIGGHSAPIYCAQFSPVPRPPRFATGAADSTARIWDCDTMTPLHTLKGHTGAVLVVAYSPDGRLLATGSQDGTVRIWDPDTGKPRPNRAMTGHSKYIRALAWEPYHLRRDMRLASASKDSTVRIWDVATGRVETVLSGHRAGVSRVRWGGTGRLYTSSQDKTVKIWNADSGVLLATLDGHAHWVNHLALSTEFALRTAFWDHTGVEPEGDAAKQARARERWEEAANFNGTLVERLVTASDDCTVYLWEPPLGPLGDKKIKPLARLLGHQKVVNHVTFSPDGKYIASSSFDNHVKLWSALDGKFLHSLRGHVRAVYASCFSADSRLLVSCSSDTTVKVWGVADGKLKNDLPGHKDEVYAVDWAPNGDMAGSAGNDKMVKLWRH